VATRAGWLATRAGWVATRAGRVVANAKRVARLMWMRFCFLRFKTDNPPNSFRFFLVCFVLFCFCLCFCFVLFRFVFVSL
jgi:hypothetical protein